MGASLQCSTDSGTGYVKTPASCYHNETRGELSFSMTPTSAEETSPEHTDAGDHASSSLAGAFNCYDTGHVKTPQAERFNEAGGDVSLSQSRASAHDKNEDSSCAADGVTSQRDQRCDRKRSVTFAPPSPSNGAEAPRETPGNRTPPHVGKTNAEQPSAPSGIFTPFRLQLASAAGVLAGICWLAGRRTVLSVLSVSLTAIFLRRERLLAGLLGWGIEKIPKKFIWTIDRICVRPCFSNSPEAWSEIALVNWTWHNPVGFKAEEDGSDGFLLKIDRLTARLRLGSLYGAIFYKRAIEIDMLFLEGVKFRAIRNATGELNLWSILDLHDDDVNIRAFLEPNRGDEDAETSEAAAPEAAAHAQKHNLMPLPPVSTTRTRNAAKFWRPEWETSKTPSRRGPIPENLPAGYKEYPIGDPRRRPRWGVPLRLDIRQAVGVDISVWLLDLLLMDKKAECKEDTKVYIKSMDIPRARFEAGDPRRAGSDDGVHGLYLGELIKTLIAEAVPHVIQGSSTSLLKTALDAAIYGAGDVGVRGTARTIEFVHDTATQIEKGVRHLVGAKSHHGGDSDCRLLVRLMQGRALHGAGERLNVYTRLELRAPAPGGAGAGGEATAEAEGEVVDSVQSGVQMWTKTPNWDHEFVLGPVTHHNAVLRVGVYHCVAYDVVFSKRSSEQFLGEIVVPVAGLLIDDPSIGSGEERVGWFPLRTAPGGSSASGAPRAASAAAGTGAGRGQIGELKLGLLLVNPERLAASFAVSSDSTDNRSAAAAASSA